MKKIFFFFASLLFLQTTANAQLVKNLYETIETQGIENVSIDLYGDYEIKKWAGNTIMIVTKVEIYDASPSIFKYFLNTKGRYNIDVKQEENSVDMTSADMIRQPIKNKGTTCYEIIKVTISIPDDFEIITKNKLSRKLDIEEATTKHIE